MLLRRRRPMPTGPRSRKAGPRSRYVQHLNNRRLMYPPILVPALGRWHHLPARLAFIRGTPAGPERCGLIMTSGVPAPLGPWSSLERCVRIFS